jgi:hypothetical protein
VRVDPRSTAEPRRAGRAAIQRPPDERAGLDELRDLLADAALWAEPSSGLEEDVVDAVTQARRAERPAAMLDGAGRSFPGARLRTRFVVIAVAVVAVAAAPFGELFAHPG